MNIALDPKKISLFFLLIVLLLTSANLVNFLAAYLYFERENISTGYFSIFNLDAEQNIPTLYSSIAILFCSILLGIIACTKREDGDRYYRFWLGLAVIFLLLAVDESVGLHEYLNWPVREALHTAGLLYYAWVIPCSVALLVFVLVYLRFLLHLPKKTMILFVASGAIYVAGAIGFETLGGLQADTLGTENVLYGFITMFEEFFEMAGIVLFIYTLLSYIDSHIEGLSIRVQSKKKSSQPTCLPDTA